MWLVLDLFVVGVMTACCALIGRRPSSQPRCIDLSDESRWN